MDCEVRVIAVILLVSYILPATGAFLYLDSGGGLLSPAANVSEPDSQVQQTSISFVERSLPGRYSFPACFGSGNGSRPEPRGKSVRPLYSTHTESAKPPDSECRLREVAPAEWPV